MFYKHIYIYCICVCDTLERSIFSRCQSVILFLGGGLHRRSLLRKKKNKNTDINTQEAGSSGHLLAFSKNLFEVERFYTRKNHRSSSPP